MIIFQRAALVCAGISLVLACGDSHPPQESIAGLGRSGTMAAAYLVATGTSADEAIAILRELRPGSIETAEQEAAVRRFEDTTAEKQ